MTWTKQPITRLAYIFILGVAIALSAHAVNAAPDGSGDSPSSFTDYAQDFSESDLSMQLMEGIFGPLWSTMLDDGGVNMEAQGNGRLLGHISLVLNAAAMAIAGLFITFTVLTGIMQTGHEGIALGKKYSTMLVPLRVVIAMIALMPVAGGYSLAQAGVMLVAKGGAGVANAVTNSAVDYIALDAGIGMSPRINGTGKFANTMLASLVCEASINARTPGAIQEAEVRPKSQQLAGLWTLHFTSEKTQLGPDVCGVYTINPEAKKYIVKNPSLAKWHSAYKEYNKNQVISDIEQAKNKAQMQAVIQLHNDLVPVAQAIVNDEEPSGSAYRQAIQTYHTNLMQAAQEMMEKRRNLVQSDVDGDGKASNQGSVLQNGVQQIKDMGWAAIGAFYWTTASMMDQIYASLEHTPTEQGPNRSRIKTVSEYDYKDTEMDLLRVKTFTKKEALISIYDADATPEFAHTLQYDPQNPSNAEDRANSLIRKMFSSNPSGWVAKRLMGGGSPIMNGQIIGRILLDTAVGGFFLYVVSRAVVHGANSTLLGKAEKLFTGVSAAVEAAMKAAGPAIMVVLMAIASLALLLAYWLPAVPMVLWIFGMIGWIIMVIEAVFAAVIWAAAHAIPEGDSWTGQHARSGYMLLLGLFMRPALMVTGMFAGMLVMSAVGMLIAILFPLMMTDSGITSFLGLLAFIAGIAILTIMLITSADRAFGMVHVLPDKVLRWISGPMENLGTSEDGNKTRMFMAGMVRRFESGAQSSAAKTGRAGGGAVAKVSQEGTVGNS